ncbi:MAG: alpha/beta fold hydrolase [Halobacteriaceae archaeon]
MPTITRDGVDLEYGAVGEGPVVAFVPDAGMGPWMWAWVTEALAGPYRVLTYAPRGCDGSDPAPSEDGYSIPALAADLEAVLAAEGTRRAHVTGCGLGGQVAVEYAASAGRVRSVTVLGTEAHPTFTPALRETLCEADPIDSLEPYLGDVLDTLDGDQVRAWRTADDAPPPIRAAYLAAATAWDPPPLYDLELPVRVLHGGDDAVWSPGGGRELAEALPRGSFDVVREAPHLLPVATPTLVADEIAGIVDTTTDR